MKNTSVRRIVESAVFVLLLSAAVLCTARVLERKKSRQFFAPFFEEAGRCDVLFFGDSRFMNGMLPLDMWADYGIAGYNLSCYGNSLPVTYWSMMNALDYADPELIVLAVNGVRSDRKISGSSGDLHTALDFFPLTRTKAQAIEDLTHDPEHPDAADDDGNLYQDIRWEYYFPLGKYHSRWSDLTRDDFAAPDPSFRGGEVLVGVMPYGEYEIIDDDLYAEEIGHGYAYLRRAIEACAQRGIDILLVNLPQPGVIDTQKHANTVSSIAEEYGVNYIDLSRLDSIVDYAVDCFDEQPHLNASGSQKVTDFLASYIRDHYPLPDRRGDPRYAHWDTHRSAYIGRKLARIRQQDNLHSLLALLHDDDFDVRMAVRDDAPLFSDDTAVTLMHNLAREHVLSGSEYDMWSNSLYPLEGFDDALWNYLPYFLHMQGGGASELTGGAAEQAAREAFGDDRAAVVIEISDRRTGETVVRSF